jgi:plastocyanin
MKRRKQLIVMTVMMVVLCNVGFTYAAEEKAEAVKVVNKIVTVKTYEGLMPATLTSQAGTTVIWVNHSPQPVEILFLDKKVRAFALRKKGNMSMCTKHLQRSIP